ncbi:hypothetical protein D3C86_1937810 [compost metagenome]
MFDTVRLMLAPTFAMSLAKPIRVLAVLETAFSPVAMTELTAPKTLADMLVKVWIVAPIGASVRSL